MFRLGRELARLKRQYPDPFRLGEEMAEDRFETLPGEDRSWSLDTIGQFLNEASEDAVRIVAGMARRQGYEMDAGALSAIGIECGVALDPVVRRYIRSGAAEADRRAIAKHREDYERAREIADETFFPEPDLWLATAPLIGTGIALKSEDIGLATAFSHNAFSPPFGETGVALGGFKARMAELIRRYIAGDEAELRARSEAASARRAEYKVIVKEVEAEFRAKGRYSGAEIIAEAKRRMAHRTSTGH